MLAVRWYLRYALSYRVRSLIQERGIDVDHVTLFRWVQRFTPELIDAARPGRHATRDRWFVDKRYVKVNGVWRYLYRAVDQYGQVIERVSNCLCKWAGLIGEPDAVWLTGRRHSHDEYIED